MGLHQDRDEADFDAPVVSVSLGDTARFRIGGPNRADPTKSLDLKSGDVLVFGGPARLAFHGIDRILKGTSTLLSDGGRINLTLRVVTPPKPLITAAAGSVLAGRNIDSEPAARRLIEPQFAAIARNEIIDDRQSKADPWIVSSSR